VEAEEADRNRDAKMRNKEHPSARDCRQGEQL
jgi:hypothetical protein